MEACQATFCMLKTKRTTTLVTLLLFFVQINCLAQTVNCDQRFTAVIDTTSQEVTVHARKNIVVSEDGGNTGFAIHGGCANQTATLTIHSVGAGACVNEGDAIEIVFSDSTRLELANKADFNCQAQSSVYFSTAMDNMGQLQLL